MKLIADCGSTKCDWLFVLGERDHRLENTRGFNPFFDTTEDIIEILKTQLLPKSDGLRPSDIWFYGTGIHDEGRAEQIRKAFNAVFPEAKVSVEHDLLGAARATCGRQAGIACILGTGSNSCYYDGTEIMDDVPSLGWLLGDEGSGTHLGKQLLRAWYYRELPADLRRDFEKAYPEGPTAIKDRVYQPGANAYLASFTRFLGEHLDHPFVYDLVTRVFDSFLDAHVVKYDGFRSVPIHFVGSIAYHFQEPLVKCLQKRNMSPGNIVRKPIYPLADFHTKLSQAEL